MNDVKLRPWSPADAAALALNVNNIKIWNNVRDFLPHPYTLADAEDFIKMATEREGPARELAIEVGGEACGCIGIEPGFDVERVAVKIGYWLGEPYWGRGIMPEAVRQMCEYTFSEFPETAKIYGDVFDFNKASQRVLEKAGFTLEAVLKKAAIKNGRLVDVHYYSLFRPARSF
jgi:RimJ/RimL family protein N-acetyltransferase